MNLPPPNQLGAPQRFDRWRPGQDNALIQAWGAQTRAIVLDLPPGLGKSLIHTTYNTAHQKSFAYLTVSRGLQDQVQREFSSIGLVDVRGMQNYECLELPGKKWNTCERGPCLDGVECSYRYKGCLYYDQVRLWTGQQRRLTNYAWWINRARKGDAIGHIDTLVMDEGHDAAEMVASAMRLTFSQDEVMLPAEPPTYLWEWKTWAEKRLLGAKSDLSMAVQGTQEHRELKDLVGRLETLITAEGEWVWEHDQVRRESTLEPVWAAPYCERLLYRNIGTLLFGSATMSKTDMKYLGLSESDYTWISGLCPFPAKNRPLLYIPTCAVGQNMSDEDVQRMIDRGDEIMDVEFAAGNRGIIHAVSYKLAKLIYHASRHTSRLLLPTARTTREKVEQFKAMRGPCAIISPALDTGYDFPYDQARFQWIPKLPFPPVKGSAILARRQDEDKQYANNITMKRISQMYGRSNRSETDWSRTYITDDNWGRWFWPAMRERFAGWLREAYRRESGVPALPAASRAA